VLLQKIDCLHNSAVMELMRGLRNQLTELISGLGAQDLGPMSLGLSHSLSRYKLKFSPEKVSLLFIPLFIFIDHAIQCFFLALSHMNQHHYLLLVSKLDFSMPCFC
jgi:RNA processing factor Prp31